MHEYLARFWERQGSLRITHTDLTYSTSVLGSDRLFRALSTYFQTYFDPLVPVLPKHIATSNGLGAMIEHVAAAISDPGEAWLVSAPYYYGFGPDLDANSQVQIASVHVPREQCNTLAEVELLDAEMERRERDVVKPKITAVLITNPHNPLGFCYSREVLLAYCRLAQRWNLFLVSDEIYANSVYDARESPPICISAYFLGALILISHCQPIFRTRPRSRAFCRSTSRRTQAAARHGSCACTV